MQVCQVLSVQTSMYLQLNQIKPDSFSKSLLLCMWCVSHGRKRDTSAYCWGALMAFPLEEVQ